MKKIQEFMFISVFTIIAVITMSISAFANDEYTLADDDWYDVIIKILDSNDEVVDIENIYLDYAIQQNGSFGPSKKLFGIETIKFQISAKSNISIKIIQVDGTQWNDYKNTTQDTYNSAHALKAGDTSEVYSLQQAENDSSYGKSYFLVAIYKDGNYIVNDELSIEAYEKDYFCIKVTGSNYQDGTISYLDVLSSDIKDNTEFVYEMENTDRVRFSSIPYFESLKINNNYFNNSYFALADGDNYFEITFTHNGKTQTYQIIIRKPSDITWKNPFSDVSTSDWFYNNVKYCNMENLILGTSETEFSPDNLATRAMVVTILYRIAGSPEVNETTSFMDINGSDWFYNAVIWANKNGIVNGYDSERFGPNDNITREQLAAILYRYAKIIYPDFSYTYNMIVHDDFDNISEYAVDAVGLASNAGILNTFVNGDGHWTIEPKDNVTRADLATAMAALNVNLLEWLEKNPSANYYY